LSRLGNGERSLAKPKACQGRVSGRERVQRQRAAERCMANFKDDFNVRGNGLTVLQKEMKDK
jgi:hypothetical protein